MKKIDDIGQSLAQIGRSENVRTLRSQVVPHQAPRNMLKNLKQRNQIFKDVETKFYSESAMELLDEGQVQCLDYEPDFLESNYSDPVIYDDNYKNSLSGTNTFEQTLAFKSISASGLENARLIVDSSDNTTIQKDKVPLIQVSPENTEQSEKEGGGFEQFEGGYAKELAEQAGFPLDVDMWYQLHPRGRPEINLGLDGHAGFNCRGIWTDQSGPHTMFKFADIQKNEEGFGFRLEPLMAPGFSVRIIDNVLKVGDKTKDPQILCNPNPDENEMQLCIHAKKDNFFLQLNSYDILNVPSDTIIQNSKNKLSSNFLNDQEFTISFTANQPGDFGIKEVARAQDLNQLPQIRTSNVNSDKRSGDLPINKFFRFRMFRKKNHALATKKNGPEIMAFTTNKALISTIWWISGIDDKGNYKLSSADNFNMSLSKELDLDADSQLDMDVTSLADYFYTHSSVNGIQVKIENKTELGIRANQVVNGGLAQLVKQAPTNWFVEELPIQETIRQCNKYNNHLSAYNHFLNPNQKIHEELEQIDAYDFKKIIEVKSQIANKVNNLQKGKDKNLREPRGDDEMNLELLQDPESKIKPLKKFLEHESHKAYEAQVQEYKFDKDKKEQKNVAEVLINKLNDQLPEDFRRKCHLMPGTEQDVSDLSSYYLHRTKAGLFAIQSIFDAETKKHQIAFHVVTNQNVAEQKNGSQTLRMRCIHLPITTMSNSWLDDQNVKYQNASEKYVQFFCKERDVFFIQVRRGHIQTIENQNIPDDDPNTKGEQWTLILRRFCLDKKALYVVRARCFSITDFIKDGAGQFQIGESDDDSDDSKSLSASDSDGGGDTFDCIIDVDKLRLASVMFPIEFNQVDVNISSAWPQRLAFLIYQENDDGKITDKVFIALVKLDTEIGITVADTPKAGGPQLTYQKLETDRMINDGNDNKALLNIQEQTLVFELKLQAYSKDSHKRIFEMVNNFQVLELNPGVERERFLMRAEKECEADYSQYYDSKNIVYVVCQTFDKTTIFKNYHATMASKKDMCVMAIGWVNIKDSKSNGCKTFITPSDRLNNIMYQNIHDQCSQLNVMNTSTMSETFSRHSKNPRIYNKNRTFSRNEYDFIKFLMVVNKDTRLEEFYFSELFRMENDSKVMVQNNLRITSSMHYDLDNDSVTICISYNSDKCPHNVYIFEFQLNDFLLLNERYVQNKLHIFEPFSFNICLERSLDSMRRGLNDYPLVTMTRHCQNAYRVGEMLIIGDQDCETDEKAKGSTKVSKLRKDDPLIGIQYILSQKMEIKRVKDLVPILSVKDHPHYNCRYIFKEEVNTIEGIPTYCYSQFHIIDESDKLKTFNIRDIKFDQYDRKQRRYIEPVSLQLIEDDREEQPFIVYNLYDGCLRDIAVIFLRRGEIVEGTFVNLMLEPVTLHTKDKSPSICHQLSLVMSSEIQIGTRPEERGLADYFTQKFVVSVLDPKSRSCQLIEMTVKYFEVQNGGVLDFLNNSDHQNNMQMRIDVSGKKIILFNKLPYQAVVYPQWASSRKQDKFYNEIVGSTIDLSLIQKDGHHKHKRFRFTNPDFSQKDYSKQFHFDNEFTVTRIQRHQKDVTAIIVESWFKSEFTQLSDIQMYQIVPGREDHTNLKILNNALKCGMNSQLNYLKDLLNSSVFNKMITTDDLDGTNFKLDYLELLGNLNYKLFQPNTMMNGYSYIETIAIEDDIQEILSKMSDEQLDETQIALFSDLFCLSPIEWLIRNSNHRKDLKFRIKCVIEDKRFIENFIIKFNMNMQSTLQVMLQHRGFHEAFEQMCDFLQNSNMNQHFKRIQIMSAINYAVTDYQEKSPQIFEILVQFLNDSETSQTLFCEKTEDVTQVNVRDEDCKPARLMITFEGDYPQEHYKPHVSKAIMYDSQDKNRKLIVDQDDMERVAKSLVTEDQLDCISTLKTITGSLSTYVITHGAVDWQDLSFSEQIRLALVSDNVYQFSQNVSFNHLVLNRFINGMIEMCEKAKTEFNEYKVLKDLIDFQFEWFPQTYYFWRFVLYIIFVFVPAIFLKAYSNKKAEHQIEIVVYATLGVILQVTMLVFEFLNLFSRRNLLRYWNIDKVLDYLCIITISAYFIIKGWYSPYELTKQDVKADTEMIAKLSKDGLGGIPDMLPLLSVLTYFAIIYQMIFFAQQIESINQQLRLAFKGFADSGSFLLLLSMFILLQWIVFETLGATFDDTGNYGDDYKTEYNDYPYVTQDWVFFLSVFRTAVGDLVPPSYDYWTGRYADSQGLAQAYILVIWCLWVFFVYLIVVNMLNYLIAILSDSYADIMATSSQQTTNGRADLNTQAIRECKSINNYQIMQPIDVVIMATEKAAEDDSWGKLQENLQKHIDKQTNEIKKELSDQKKAQAAILQDLDQIKVTLSTDFKENMKMLMDIQKEEITLVLKKGISAATGRQFTLSPTNVSSPQRKQKTKQYSPIMKQEELSHRSEHDD